MRWPRCAMRLSVDAAQMICVRCIASVAHQTTGGGKLALKIDCWNAVAEGECAELRPNLIGSPPVVNTIGTVEVAALAACAAGVVVAAMTVTLC